jgi:E3 ubiquitin-protein ligase HUWE1
MLIIKIPQLVLHLRTLEVQLPSYIGEKTTFIRFIVKYLSWVGGDKLANFMHNYLCDINLLSCGYGVTVA